MVAPPYLLSVSTMSAPAVCCLSAPCQHELFAISLPTHKGSMNIIEKPNNLIVNSSRWNSIIFNYIHAGGRGGWGGVGGERERMLACVRACCLPCTMGWLFLHDCIALWSMLLYALQIFYAPWCATSRKFSLIASDVAKSLYSQSQIPSNDLASVMRPIFRMGLNI